MKHYLKLVPISAKIHHKQSKMTRICITLALIVVIVLFTSLLAVRGPAKQLQNMSIVDNISVQ